MKRKTYAVFALLLLMLGAAVRSIAGASGSAEYVAAAAGQSLYKLDIARTRGMIYDCRLRPLVSEKKRWIAAVAPTIEAVGALEKATGGKYRARLAQALEDGKPFFLEVEDSRELRGLNENPCIDLFSIPKRYSEDQIAPHVIGYLDGMGAGAAGVELAMDDLLEDRSGQAAVYYQVDALGRAVAGGSRRIEDTLKNSKGGAVLTLDRELQQMAEEAAAPLKKGAVVITEVPDCEIRALVSLPDYSPDDLETASKSADSPLVDRAFSAYAPGSVFKLVSAAAALEAGGVLETYTCTGSVNAGGLLFHCFDGKAHGTLNLRGALEKSCNCYFISCVRSLGGQNVLNMAYNLGLGAGQEFGRGLFSEAGNLPEAASLENPRALANFSFGQGEVTTTPLQLCALVNTIASGGVFSTPRLIAGTVDEDLRLTEVQPVTDKKVRAMAASTAQTLRDCMEGAVLEGTARPGAPKNCAAGVKTGTAQTGVYENGQELLHFWYCGYVKDAAGPRYCVTVLAESTPDDGGAAARVFKQVAEGLGRMMEKSGAGEG